MKVQPQTTSDLKMLCEAVEDQRFAMLTVADGGGALTSRPMTPLEMDGEGNFWFFVSKRSMSENLTAPTQPVNLSFADTDNSTYVSITGQAQLLVDADRIAELWTPMARPWFPDGQSDGDLALLRVRPQRAEIWDGPDSTIMRSLALGASIVAAKPIGLGSHEVVQPT